MGSSSHVSIPNLPGYSVAEPITSGRPKTQSLQYRNGYPVQLALPKDGDALQQRNAQMWAAPPVATAATAANSSAFEPKYVKYDKKVLRYFGWFGEPVPDSPLESWRVRRVQVLLYLEDETMQVTESSAPNSGIMQGTLVRRHKCPKEGGGFLAAADLAVGSSVRIYGREVHVVDADTFTRKWVAASGAALAPPLPYPASPIEEVLTAMSKPSGLSRSDPDSPSKFAEALLGREHNSKALQQFLQHGGEVLRFWALWDDRAAEFGERHMYKLHYFVADSTAEIMELHEPNSGRLSFPTMFKRAQLPRQHLPGALPGQSRLAPEQCYAPADLRVGATLPVLGRQLFIYDCDDATRAWYTDRLGFSADMLAPIDVSEPVRQLPKPELPPARYGLGIGSPEDSLQNCLRLVPKPPKRDNYRWQKLDTVVLRFEAALEPAEGRRLISIDHERRFVVSFYMADQTLSVFEPPQPNTGLPGGRFLERAKVYKPGSKLAWYTEAEMAVGQVLDLHGRRFRLTAADAFTAQWQAQNAAHEGECAQAQGTK